MPPDTKPEPPVSTIEPTWITLKQAAGLLSIEPKSVRALVRRGRLDARLGPPAANGCPTWLVGLTSVMRRRAECARPKGPAAERERKRLVTRAWRARKRSEGRHVS